MKPPTSGWMETAYYFIVSGKPCLPTRITPCASVSKPPQQRNMKKSRRSPEPQTLELFPGCAHPLEVVSVGLARMENYLDGCTEIIKAYPPRSRRSSMRCSRIKLLPQTTSNGSNSARTSAPPQEGHTVAVTTTLSTTTEARSISCCSSAGMRPRGLFMSINTPEVEIHIPSRAALSTGKPAPLPLLIPKSRIRSSAKPEVALRAF